MTTENRGDSGFGEWRNHILESLKRHEDSLRRNEEKLEEVLRIVQQIEIEQSAQRVKVGMLGSLTGGIGAGIVMAIKSFVGKP